MPCAPVAGRLTEVLGVWRMRQSHPAGSRHTFDAMRRSDVQRAAAGSTTSFITTRDDDSHLLAAVREGDESAFVMLVERYHTSLQRMARLYVDASSVEDVVQDTWIAVLHGVAKFEGRASFKTWLFRILVNRARTRAVRNARTVAMSALVQEETETEEYAVDPARFRPADDRYPGHWMPLLKPSAEEMPEERLLAGELATVVRTALLE